LRSIAAAEGFTVRASELGKSKMIFQVIGVSLVMLSSRWATLRPIALAAMWGVVIFGLISAFDYFRKFWRKVDTSIKLRRRNELIALERQKRRLQRGVKTQEVAHGPKAASVRRSG
jgi:CDP-diacylglycerol--glycerol-3-phosphate 3-phosphatidyltransferase